MEAHSKLVRTQEARRIALGSLLRRFFRAFNSQTSVQYCTLSVYYLLHSRYKGSQYSDKINILKGQADNNQYSHEMITNLITLLTVYKYYISPQTWTRIIVLNIQFTLTFEEVASRYLRDSVIRAWQSRIKWNGVLVPFPRGYNISNWARFNNVVSTMDIDIFQSLDVCIMHDHTRIPAK